MSKLKYTRIEEIVNRKNVNDWLDKHLVNKKIIYYSEFPSIDNDHIRIIILAEETKSKKFL